MKKLTNIFKQSKSFIDSGLILAAASAFLYCVSCARFDGYLHPFRMDPDVLTRNFQQTLYDGFVNSFKLLILLSFSYAIIRGVYACMIFPELNKFLKKTGEIKGNS